LSDIAQNIQTEQQANQNQATAGNRRNLRIMAHIEGDV
jgi:hypothetical protein